MQPCDHGGVLQVKIAAAEGASHFRGLTEAEIEDDTKKKESREKQLDGWFCARQQKAEQPLPPLYSLSKSQGVAVKKKKKITPSPPTPVSACCQSAQRRRGDLKFKTRNVPWKCYQPCLCARLQDHTGSAASDFHLKYRNQQRRLQPRGDRHPDLRHIHPRFVSRLKRFCAVEGLNRLVIDRLQQKKKSRHLMMPYIPAYLRTLPLFLCCRPHFLCFLLCLCTCSWLPPTLPLTAGSLVVRLWCSTRCKPRNIWADKSGQTEPGQYWQRFLQLRMLLCSCWKHLNVTSRHLVSQLSPTTQHRSRKQEVSGHWQFCFLVAGWDRGGEGYEAVFFCLWLRAVSHIFVMSVK